MNTVADAARPLRKRGQRADVEPTKKPAPKPAVDWLALRNAFVYGTFDAHGTRVFPDLQQVAAAHGLSYATVRAVARRGNRSVRGAWTEERRLVQDRFVEVIETKRANKAADAIVEMEARHLKLWSAAEASTSRKLFEVRGGVVVGFNPSLSVTDARSLIEMLRAATTMQRLLMGVPDEPIVVREKHTEPTVLKLLTPEDLAQAGRQLAMAMTNKRKALQALPSDIEVGGAKDDPYRFARATSVDPPKRRLSR